MNSSNTNGRVNIMDQNTTAVFTLSDHIPVDDKSDFREALNGSWNNTPLSLSFFSSKNINMLQNGLRYGVYVKSNNQFIIGQQNIDELKIIMRSIFLQNSKNLPNNIGDQINDLNNKVLEYAINQIYGEAESYMKYKRDASSLVSPMELPTLTNYNNKQLECKHFF
tara:strand:+ start:1021 stop:1518 length:498 start_codon:yes stop_codon:yes gene_type:complete